MNATPIYTSLVAERGIVPEQIYARCAALVHFTYPDVPARRRVTPPAPGARPTVSKKRKARR